MIPALLSQCVGFTADYACSRLSSGDPRLDLHPSYTFFDEFSVPLLVTREMDLDAVSKLAPLITSSILRVTWMDPPKPGALVILYWSYNGILASSGAFVGLIPGWDGWRRGPVELLDVRTDPTRRKMMEILGISP